MNQPTVRLQFEGNLGYAADQVESELTLGELLAHVKQAVEDFGGDARVVAYQTNNRYGASFGRIETFEDTFVADGDEDDEDE